MASTKTIEIPSIQLEIVNTENLLTIESFFNGVSEIFQKIVQINEKAQYNKNISKSILCRLLSTEAVIKSLFVQKEQFRKEIASLKCQESLNTLLNILEKIKDFASQVTQLRGLEKWVDNVQAIGKNYRELMKEYENGLNSLKFLLRKIDDECLKNDIEETGKFLERYSNYHKGQTNIIYLEVECNKNKFDSNNSIIDIPTIDSNLLHESSDKERRGKLMNIIKMVYKDSINVACKQITIKTETKLLHNDLTIQRRLFDCPNILKFYGLSGTNDIMVHEWAEKGNLKELYEKEKIPWSLKSQIAFGICKGITFLNAVGIFHRHLRCQNVMGMRESFDDFDSFDDPDPHDKIIKDGFKDLIQKAWKHYPRERISINILYLRLLELSSIDEKSSSLKPADSCSESDSAIHEDTQNNTNITEILTVKEGIMLHRSKTPENREMAWKCFENNAKLKSPLSIYWKGYYLWEGLYPTGTERSKEQKDKDQSEARELFKIAADEGIADAQFWYAFSIPRTSENREKFLDNLSKSAENGNAAALYSLGDVYLHGKAHVNIDKKKGLRCLKLSAYKGHHKANEMLKKLDTN
ncbi:20870_t:CDS:2, partial [Racocetra persica]